MQQNLIDVSGLERRTRVDRRSMSYLLDRVTAELQDRIREMVPETGDWLLIDFPDSSLILPGKLERRSLLGQGALSEPDDLPGASFEAVVVNLQLAWLDPFAQLPRILRLLKPGGHLFFTTFGPDTLFELREAWAAVDALPHVHPFVDLHHLGDLLVRSGLKKSIVDSDWLGVQYEDGELLMQDLRSAGFHNIHRDRRKTLTGKGRFRQLTQQMARSGSPFNVTWEIVYGYAQKPEPAHSDGVQVNFSG